MNRIELCERLKVALGDRAPAMSAHAMADLLQGWELVDVCGAVAMFKGPEMHVGAIPEVRGRWFNRKAVRIMRERLGRYGRLETSVMLENKAGMEFVRRLGFEPVGMSGAAICYELRKLRHA